MLGSHTVGEGMGKALPITLKLIKVRSFDSHISDCVIFHSFLFIYIFIVIVRAES